MVYTAPSVADVCTLDDSEAQQLWNWLLQRQGLSDETKFQFVLDIAHATLGLHAARLPSPFSTVLARGATPTVALSLFTSKTRSDLMTVRCMRKTLHTLPLPLAATAHSATIHFRERDALRAITNAGISARVILHVTDAIVDLLHQNGLLFHREIETKLVGRQATVVAVRLALKLAWERGMLTYVNDTNGWNRENRKFTLTRVSYPSLDMSMDRGKATGKLIREYFDRYGPASLRDVMWWSGLSRSAITTAMRESGRDFVEIRASWCDSSMYMYRDRLEEFRSTAPTQRRSGMNFLAHEDVALKAYFESRRRYLGELSPRQAFNQIGEVLPTIVLEGQVVGTWAWNASTRAVSFSIVRGFSSPDLRMAVRSQASTLSDALRLGWAQERKSNTEKKLEAR